MTAATPYEAGMYIPGSFAERERAVLHGLMREHAFATLITTVEGAPVASHIPFLLDAERGEHGTLVAHLARANPQWRSFDAEALVIFQGAHGYVSPTWYAGGDNVPTWNYAVVHAYGRPRLLDDAASARRVIDRLAAVYENGRSPRWSTDSVPAAFVDKLVGAIVAFEIPISRLEGKFKLNQNKSDADRAGVVAALHAEGNAEATALANLMEARVLG